MEETVCVCARARACVRACLHACVRTCACACMDLATSHTDTQCGRWPLMPYTCSHAHTVTSFWIQMQAALLQTINVQLDVSSSR